jgi:hypothetical protein
VNQLEVNAKLQALDEEAATLRHAEACGLRNDPLPMAEVSARRRARLEAIELERQALQTPEPPPPEPVPSITAEVLLQRASASVFASLPLQVRIQNHGELPAVVTEIAYFAAPGSTAVLPQARGWDGLSGPRPVVEPHGELHHAFSVSFNSAGSYRVAAQVRLATGEVVDAEPVEINVVPVGG